MITHIDEVSSTLYYIGTATGGNEDASAVWDITRITITGGDVEIEQPVNIPRHRGVWDDRATYSYG